MSEIVKEVYAFITGSCKKGGKKTDIIIIIIAIR